VPIVGSAACDTASTSSSTPAVPVTAPATSIGRCPSSAGGSPGSDRIATSSTTTTIGALIRKIQGQPSRSVSTPPSTRPTLNPADALAAKTPRARFRCAPSGKVVAMIDTAAGTVSAAPMPCTQRAATSSRALGASPAASDITPNSTSPPRKTRRRP
jgi:hypothetical protein